MLRSGKFIVVIALMVCTLLATSGCSMFQKKQPKRPDTVEAWLAQPRVQPVGGSVR
jgi:hypothetical protein